MKRLLRYPQIIQHCSIFIAIFEKDKRESIDFLIYTLGMKLIVLLLLFCSEGLLAAVSNAPDISRNLLTEKIDKAEKQTLIIDNENSRQLELTAQHNRIDRRQLWPVLGRCEQCHSSEMYTDNGYMPILQGQNAAYLLSKIMMLKHNPRSFHPMGPYLQKLNADQILQISSYYAEQKSDLKRVLVSDFPESGSNSPATIQACADCHGFSGNGDGVIPAISGQNENYLSYRIREIADDRSRMHVSSDAPVSCDIPLVSIRKSRELAQLFGIVIDRQRAQNGANIYANKCKSCHDRKTGSTAVKLTTRQRLKEAQLGHRNNFGQNNAFAFSHNELKNAIHFMIMKSL